MSGVGKVEWQGLVAVWVNGKILNSSHPKADKWKPEPPKEKTLWGLCACGEVIHDGDTVGMRADHKFVICYQCCLSEKFTEDMHIDCAGLRFPDATLSQ